MLRSLGGSREISSSFTRYDRGYTLQRLLTLGPKYVSGKRRVANEVETLPSASVIKVEERVNQDGNCWEG